jgi:hypothetical protein
MQCSFTELDDANTAYDSILGFILGIMIIVTNSSSRSKETGQFVALVSRTTTNISLVNI